MRNERGVFKPKKGDPAPREEHRGARRRAKGVTILELLVVVLIIGILATIATGVYIGQTARAKIVATQDQIREITIAATRFFLDTGEFPPSGTATVTIDPASLTPVIGPVDRRGSGLLYLTLVHSISGDAFNPIPSIWGGPYMEFQAVRLGPDIDPTTGLNSNELGRTQILDVFARPFQYVFSADYAIAPFQGAVMFEALRIPGFDFQRELPENNPFFATETHYNAISFQIYSFGPNGLTFGYVPVPPLNLPDFDSMVLGLADIFPGTETDDINNYGY